MKEIELYRLQDMIRSIENLNGKCEHNMKSLNNMMLELKGLIAMVRPSARKNEWYGTEVTVTGNVTTKEKDHELEVYRENYKKLIGSVNEKNN